MKNTQVSQEFFQHIFLPLVWEHLLKQMATGCSHGRENISLFTVASAKMANTGTPLGLQRHGVDFQGGCKDMYNEKCAWELTEHLITVIVDKVHTPQRCINLHRGMHKHRC